MTQQQTTPASMSTDPDSDPVETNEWIDSIQAVMRNDGGARAHYLLERMADEARRAGAEIPFAPTTAYINTIPTQMQSC